MKVGIIMGSKSDLDTMKKASAVLDEFNIPYEMVIASAHRTPEAVKDFVTRLEDEGAIAFIAGAGPLADGLQQRPGQRSLTGAGGRSRGGQDRPACRGAEQ